MGILLIIKKAPFFDDHLEFLGDEFRPIIARNKLSHSSLPITSLRASRISPPLSDLTSKNGTTLGVRYGLVKS